MPNEATATPSTSSSTGIVQSRDWRLTEREADAIALIWSPDNSLLALSTFASVLCAVSPTKQPTAAFLAPTRRLVSAV
jgi:hypothetical protein